jgi:hypothetical protein
MTLCPHCHNTNVEEKFQRGINVCADCGAQFREDYIFTEGSYRTFMENVLNKAADGLQPNAASAIINLRDHVLDDKNDIQSIVETLIDITQKVDSQNDLGYDRKTDVIGIVEGIEKISAYAKVLASRDEISERTAYRMAILEGADPNEWLDQPQVTPDLAGQPQGQPQASDIVSAGAPVDTGSDPAGDILPPAGMPPEGVSPEDMEASFKEAMWMGKPVKVSCKEGKYTVIGEGGPMITYNETTGEHDGIENFSEEQLAELDAAIGQQEPEAGGQIGGVSDHDIDVQGIDNIDPTYNNAVEGEPLADPNAGAQGTITSTETTDPSAEAEALSQPMIADETAALPEPSTVAGTQSDSTSLKALPLYGQVVKNLTSQMKRGTFDEANALNAFKRVVKQSHTVDEAAGGVDSAAQSLLDEFKQSVDGPIGSPAAQAAPAVDGGIGAPVVGEGEQDDNFYNGTPPPSEDPAAAGDTSAFEAGFDANKPEYLKGDIKDESAPEGLEVETLPGEGEVVEPEAGEEMEILGQPIEDEEHEEAEAEAVEAVGTKAEKAQAKIESAEEAIAALKQAVEELSALDSDGEEAGECEGGECEAGEEVDGTEGDDEFGEVEDDGEEKEEKEEPAEDKGEDEGEEKEKIEELAKKKVGKHDYVAKPEIIPAKREATGEKPDGHIVKYVSSKHDPSKPAGEQWSEEEAKIPLTQAEADESEVDENGKKKASAGKKNAKDSHTEKDWKAGRPGTKGDKLEEMTRFNGYRLGDKVKVPGYAKSFELVKISGSPVKLTLTEGKVTITLDANNDQYELDGDLSFRQQRQSYILEDTRAVWESMEKEILTEGCAGGVCSIGGPMTALNSTSGIGNVTSASAMFIRTPLRSLSKEISPDDIYAYIKNNSLHMSPRETAIGHVMSNFQNPSVDVAKIYDDAVLSLKAGSSCSQLNEVDSSYGYKTESTRDIDVENSLNEGYDALKKLGIV